MAIRSTRPSRYVSDIRSVAAFSLAERRLRGEPSKYDLRAMLVEAAKNTAEPDPRIDEFARAVGPLFKGKRH